MRLSTKLLAISFLVLLVLVAGMIFPIRLQMRSQAIHDIKQELESVAATAALQIDGDLHAQLAGDGTADSPAFAPLRKTLHRIASVNQYTPDNIYTFYEDRQAGLLRFGVMLQKQTFVGGDYEVHEHQAMAAQAGTAYSSGLFTDDYGAWIAAVAPIRDAEGNITGLLEVNQRASAYFARVDEAIITTTVASLVGLLLASAVGYLVLQHLVIRPVGKIHDGMIALANQDFSHETKVQSGDELQELAQTLNHMAKQLNVAKSIQAGFVPANPPQAPGYRFAYRSDPCDATGGDYIDAFDLPDGKTAILVADVTGHGLGPSLIMASCRSALRALARTGLEPGHLVARLERQLMDDLTEGRFITMVVGILHPDGSLTYANAGHAPALVVRRGEVIRLDSHRPPLGIFLDPPGDQDPPLDDTQTTMSLEPGDRIVLTSDGVNEAQDAQDQQFGLERIETTIRRTDLDADAVVNQLNRQLTLHRGERPAADDVTMLCVDRVALVEVA